MLEAQEWAQKVAQPLDPHSSRIELWGTLIRDDTCRWSGTRCAGSAAVILEWVTTLAEVASPSVRSEAPASIGAIDRCDGFSEQTSCQASLFHPIESTREEMMERTKRCLLEQDLEQPCDLPRAEVAPLRREGAIDASVR